MSAVLRVEEPGLLTTIQDLGRPGHRASGVPQGGAMDRFALVAANLLVGNPEGAAGLECLLAGPSLVALEPCLVAVTGGDLQPTVNDQPAPGWTGIFMAKGDRLAFAGRRSGARAYVAVAGGLQGERWLGSLATYLLVGKGGFKGRPLKKKDELALAMEPRRPVIAERHLPADLRPSYRSPAVLRAIPGPHLSRLSPRSRRELFGEPFQLSRESDRMGYRLEGRELEIKGKEILSFGVAFGSIQVPSSGQAILLMADHQTAGGYPIVAGVARADLPLAAQLLPGESLSFARCGVEEAQAAWSALRKGLDLLGRPPAARPASPPEAPPRRRAGAAPASAATATSQPRRGRG